MKITKIFFGALFGLVCFFSIPHTFAQSSTDPNQKFQKLHLLAPFPGMSDTIDVKNMNALDILAFYISGAFLFGQGAIGIFSVIMIMIGGYEFMFAGPDSGATENAKKRISMALFGLLAVFLSAVFLNFINPDFYNL